MVRGNLISRSICKTKGIHSKENGMSENQGHLSVVIHGSTQLLNSPTKITNLREIMRLGFEELTKSDELECDPKMSFLYCTKP